MHKWHQEPTGSQISRIVNWERGLAGVGRRTKGGRGQGRKLKKLCLWDSYTVPTNADMTILQYTNTSLLTGTTDQIMAKSFKTETNRKQRTNSQDQNSEPIESRAQRQETNYLDQRQKSHRLLRRTYLGITHYLVPCNLGLSNSCERIRTPPIVLQ